MIHFIVNPMSGQGKAEKAMPIIDEMMRFYNVAYYLRLTNGKREVEEFTKEAIKEEAKVIVAVGGDGTINEISSVMANLDTKIPLGIIPCGSGNDFVRSELGKHWKFSKEEVRKQLHKILEFDYKPIDMIKANDKWVINMAIFGLGSDIAHRAESTKGKYGSSAYMRATVDKVLTYKSFPATIRIDEEAPRDIDIYLLCVGNGGFYGNGIELCLDAKADDGKISILLAEPLSKLKIIRLFYHVLRSNHKGKSGYESIECEKISIDFKKKEKVSFDGNVFETDEPLHLELKHNKLNLIL